MSYPPSGDQGAGKRAAETINVDRAQGMQVGDNNTQSNTFTHISADGLALLRQETEAGRDAYIAGRDQYITQPETPKPCGCGKDSTGGCLNCKSRVCDKHGVVAGRKFLCTRCWHEREKDALQAQAARREDATATVSVDGGICSYKSYQPHYAAYRPWVATYRPKVEGIMFNLTATHGGLIIYADYTWRGQSLRIQWEYNGTKRPDLVANVVMRKIDGHYEYAAVFSHVCAGNWILALDEESLDFTVFPQQIAEIDLRRNG